MTRVLFYGNSHLASIKMGWDERQAAYPDIEAAFFGAPAQRLRSMVVTGDRLVAEGEKLREVLQTLWGRTEVRPDDFDVIAVVGMGAAIRPLLPLYRRYRSDDHRNRDGTYQRVSPALFRAIVESQVADNLAVVTMRQLRAVSRRPIVLINQPLMGEKAEIRDKLVREEADGAALQQALNDALSAKCDIDAILTQPEETKATPLLTKRAYSAGSVKLTGDSHEDEDTTHTNGLYGALVIDQMAAWIGANLAGASKPAPAKARKARA